MQNLLNISQLKKILENSYNNLLKKISVEEALKEIFSMIFIHPQNLNFFYDIIPKMLDECSIILFEKLYEIITFLINKFFFFFLFH
jgi:hypothetical protein